MFFLFALIGVIFVWKKHVSIEAKKNIFISNQTSLTSQIVQVKRNHSYLSNDLKKDSRWKQFKDYTISTTDLIQETTDFQDLAQYSRAMAVKLTDCLTQNLCDQVQEPNQVYFDP